MRIKKKSYLFTIYTNNNKTDSSSSQSHLFKIILINPIKNIK